MKNIKRFLWCLLLVNGYSASASMVGYSGMVQMDADRYLVVMDKKSHEGGNRTGMLDVKQGGGMLFTSLHVGDWRDGDGKASDLESVCRLPEREGEYLLAESGYWQGRYGRIFHIVVNGRSASVKSVYAIPKIVMRSKGVDGDNFEGMVCFKKGEQTVVVLGERGGSEHYRNGLLRIGLLDYNSSTLSWEQYRNRPLEIVAPGNHKQRAFTRTISELYLDASGIIWAVATEDAGDQGPFKSIIYQAARISDDGEAYPLTAIQSKQAYRTIDGFKVEALAAPSRFIKGSVMSMGTEDESYGGVWRPLF